MGSRADARIRHYTREKAHSLICQLESSRLRRVGYQLTHYFVTSLSSEVAVRESDNTRIRKEFIKIFGHAEGDGKLPGRRAGGYSPTSKRRTKRKLDKWPAISNCDDFAVNCRAFYRVLSEVRVVDESRDKRMRGEGKGTTPERPHDEKVNFMLSWSGRCESSARWRGSGMGSLMLVWVGMGEDKAQSCDIA